jgi:hypothetical protein
VADELKLEQPDDWRRLREAGLTTVLDPMVFRAGELFLAGRSGAHLPAALAWQSLSANISGLAAFFDALVFSERLPIFDYYVTFPETSAVGGSSFRLVPFVNAAADVLVPVRVYAGAYQPLREAALAELQTRPQVSDADRRSILAEMEAFGYEWTPTLDGYEPASEGERRLAAFLYGGLLFSAYAQELRGTHVLQQKRARLFGRVSLGSAADDQQLFAQMAALPDVAPEAVSAAVEIPRAPSVLPYLLRAAADSPTAMLQAALALRVDADLVAYRKWRRELLDELAIGGSAQEQVAELAAVRAQQERKLGDRGVPVKVSVEAVALVIPVVKVETHVEGKVGPRPWGWVVGQVRGDHRKLITRLVAAQRSFTRLDLLLRQVWERG